MGASVCNHGWVIDVLASTGVSARTHPTLLNRIEQRRDLVDLTVGAGYIFSVDEKACGPDSLSLSF